MGERGRHRVDAAGRVCRRCALPRLAGNFCPPGFWMTDEEIDTWSMLPAGPRQEMESTLGTEPEGDE